VLLSANSTFTGFLEHVAQENQVPIEKKYEQNPKTKAAPLLTHQHETVMSCRQPAP